METPVDTPPPEIYHTILPTDNLRGICLKYNVTVTSVRQLNQFSGDNIKGFTRLRIPVKNGRNEIRYDEREAGEEALLREFRRYTQLHPTEARFYLEDNGWDLDLAIQSFIEDSHFEEENVKESTFATSLPAEFDTEGTPNKSNVLGQSKVWGDGRKFVSKLISSTKSTNIPTEARYIEMNQTSAHLKDHRE